MSEMKYVLTTVVRKQKEDLSLLKFWDSLTMDKEEIRLFHTFEEAKSAMAEAIKTLIKENSFFPFKEGKYLPFENHYWDCFEEVRKDPQAQLFRKVLTNVLSDPGAQIEGVQDLNYLGSEEQHCGYVVLGRKESILAYFDLWETYRLETNIHNMTDEYKTYYFDFKETNVDRDVINAIEVRLVKAE